MSYAIIGFGNIGQALAKAFARSGIEVSVATTRDPESFASAAAAIGPEIIPKKLAEAVKADIVFLAVRYESHRDGAKALPTWKGKTIIDVTNAYGVSLEELGGQPSSKVVANAFPGARVVKGFNHLPAGTLAADPNVRGGRRVGFLSDDDEGGGPRQTTRLRTRQSREARRGWRAGARAGQALGASDLPGPVQEGAVSDIRPSRQYRDHPTAWITAPEMLTHLRRNISCPTNS